MPAARSDQLRHDGPKLRYMPALDGVRGVAVIGVILFHAGLLRGGFLGVDLFFVLSGFLITSLLLVEIRAVGRVRLMSFWARRARRLLPPLLLVLAAVCGYAAWLASPTELARLRGDGIAALFYYANWHALLAEQNYWDLFSVPSPLAHTWSLAIEEQFYLLWPLAMVGLCRFAKKRAAVFVMGCCLGGAVVSWAWMMVQYVPGADTSRIYYGTDTRACALLIGAALAAALTHYGHARSTRGINGLAMVALLVTGAAWWWLDGHASLLYRGGFVVCQLAAVALLTMAAHPAPGLLSRALSWGPLRYLGRISYGLYLWHWPVFVVVSEARLGLGGTLLLALRVAVSMLLAVVCYHAFELPLRKGMRGRRAWLLAVGAMAALLGVMVISTEPRSGPVERQRAWLPSTAGSAPPLSILIAGDSVAERLAAQLSPLGSRLSLQVVAGAQAGCGLIEPQARLRRPDGAVLLPSRDCPPLDARWAELGPADVALYVIGAPSQGEYELDGAWRRPCQPRLDGHFEARALSAIDALATRAPRVYLATMPYLTSEGYGAQEDRHTDCLNRALARAVAARPAAHMIDLAGYVCPQGRCRTRISGVLLRYDGQHFEGEGAELIGWWLSEQVRAEMGRRR